MTPSSAQSQLRVPPSWVDMARLISLLPKPPCPVGLATGGPLRSVQTTTTSSSWLEEETSSGPSSEDSAVFQRVGGKFMDDEGERRGAAHKKNPLRPRIQPRSAREHRPSV